MGSTVIEEQASANGGGCGSHALHISPGHCSSTVVLKHFHCKAPVV